MKPCNFDDKTLNLTQNFKEFQFLSSKLKYKIMKGYLIKQIESNWK